MANTFSFQLSEDFLRGYATYLEHIREDTGKAHQLTITVGLIPDGVGYEVSGPPEISIDEVKRERSNRP